MSIVNIVDAVIVMMTTDIIIEIISIIFIVSVSILLIYNIVTNVYTIMIQLANRMLTFVWVTSYK